MCGHVAFRCMSFGDQYQVFVSSDLFIHGCVPHEEEAEEASRPIPSGVRAQLGSHYSDLQEEGQRLGQGVRRSPGHQDPASSVAPEQSTLLHTSHL